MNTVTTGNAKFQAFLRKESANTQPAQQPASTEQVDTFIATIVGAQDQKACGYGGGGGGGCR